MRPISYHNAATCANEISYSAQTSNTHKYTENSWKTRFAHPEGHKATFRISSTPRHCALLSVKSTKIGSELGKAVVLKMLAFLSK